MLRLYYIPGACSMAPHIVLEESGAAFEPVAIDFYAGDHRQPEFLRLNPKGYVGVLITDRGPISENAAIMAYIAQAFPQARLAPTDPYDFAQVQAFNLFLASAVHITYRHLSKPTLFADGADAARALAAKVPAMTERYFALIEDQLSDGRTWVHGDDWTISDAYLFIYASYLQRGDRGDPDRFPLVRAHRERVLARPATQRVLAREGLGDPGTRRPAIHADRFAALETKSA
ncbi:MAG: glutathione S-transferase family protein [bacterium]|nr:glutathione S-transferase family protein [bacterium]